MKSTINKATPQPKMYETENDISQNRRVEISALSNQRLADAVDLQTQMKQAHWNVKGPHFIGLHELFDKIDEAVEAYVDLIAERIVQLGGIAEGTARVAAGRSRLEEYSLTIADGSAHVEAVSKALREKWLAHIEAALYRPVLIVDEAQEMNPLVLSELRLLASADLDFQKRFFKKASEACGRAISTYTRGQPLHVTTLENLERFWIC